MPQTHRQALPKGYMLQEYQVDRVLGAGGFGLTYLGWDTALEKPVAVKEYLPNDLAVRETNHSVAAKSRDDEDNFRWGLTRFLDEARTLARFKHPNIVSVYRYFEAHGTAYIVMEFVEGETFGAYLKRAGKPKESFLCAVLTALLDGLAEVHRAGFMHRDIKPGNILLNAKGVPVLVDFGSARQEIGGRSRSITSVVTPGYAPIEQYSSRGNQGPWTDIYALGAVAYRAVTGEVPPDATERVLDDSIKPAVEAARDKYSAEFLRTIDSALAVNSKDRLRDVDAWRDALVGDAPTNKPATPADVILSENDLLLNDRAHTQKPADEAPAKREALQQDCLREEQWADGTVATGRYVDGKRHGHWVVRRANGDVFEGPLVDGKEHGKWVLRFADGDFAEGPYIDGKFRGHWVLRTANGGVREGQYVDGKESGHWVKRDANGTVKKGTYVDGKKHGKWVLQDADGHVVEGTYKDGKKHGHWVLRFASGGVQEGPFVNGKKHGHWVERFADGSVGEGPFVGDKKHGHWVLRGADGTVAEGQYVDGKQHGKWVVRFPDGTEVKVNWRNGEIVDE